MTTSLHESHPKPSLHLTLDTGDFTENSVQEAIAELHSDFRVEVTEIARFSNLPSAQVLLEIVVTTLQAVPITLVSSALYDVLKAHFLKPKKASSTHFTLEVRDSRWELSVAVETNNKDALRQCIDMLADFPLVRGASEEEWESAVALEERESENVLEVLRSIEKGQTPESLHKEFTRRLGGENPRVRVRRLPKL